MTQQKRTGLFLGVLLFAGVCNMFTRTKIPFLNTLMFCLNFLLCAGLLFLSLLRVLSSSFNPFIYFRF